VGYEVSNNLRVKVTELEKLGTILDSAVTAGFNRGGGISFSNSNIEELMAEARRAAIRDAIAKAKDMTEAAGIKTGKILSIQENTSGRPIPLARSTFAAEAVATPIETGENTYRASVTVTFSLKQN
jgi:uncharacterized protein YggE